MSNQNPTTKPSLHERELDNHRWVSIRRACDNPETNFQKIRTIKPKQIDSKLIIEDKP